MVGAGGAVKVPAATAPHNLDRWSQRFEEVPTDAVLERLATLAPREMRRGWMTGFGNARLAGRGAVELADLPDGAARRSPIGFMQ